MAPPKQYGKRFENYGDHFIPSAFFSVPGGSKKHLALVRQLDRFIPSRKVQEPLSERLQIAAYPGSLTPTERMLRNNDSTPDPFGSRPRANTVPAERSRLMRRA